MESAWHNAPVHRREALSPGHSLPGPALLIEPNQTLVIEPGWQAAIAPGAEIVLTRIAPRPHRAVAGTSADPVMLEIFNNLFMSIAEQMGLTLEKTAASVNIKERLDSAPSTMPTGHSSPTRRTCRCIWAPWATASPPSAPNTRT